MSDEEESADADPDFRERLRTTSATNRAEAAAYRLRDAVWASARLVATTTYTFLANLLSMPLSSAIGRVVWKGLLVRSLHGYHKAAKGDAVGLIRTPSGEIHPTAIKWKTHDDVGEDERTGWHARAFDAVWKQDTYGRELPRMGKTPVKPLDLDSWRATSFLEARVAEAVDQGDTQPLYRVDEAELTATLDYQGSQANPMADGGYNINDVKFEPRSSPIFDDTIIDLGSGDWDGQAVSWDKAKELYTERTTTEEMHNQEQRGYLAGMSKKDMKSFAIKMMIIAGVIAALGLIGPELVNSLFGSGGGGGGGAIPI